MFENNYLNKEFNNILNKYPHEVEFHETVKEMLLSIDSIIEYHPEYEEFNIIKKILEPEKVISFKIKWVNEKRETEVNNGYRVQYSSVLGIYKGGIRFDKSVNLSILKFLAFEQTFKNALTPLSLGGAKGGSDFDPTNKSEEDIKRFIEAFMLELYKYIGDEIDVPAGDLGVGKYEVGLMDSFYKKFSHNQISAFTGKDISIGGIKGRAEATGFGLVYFTSEALKTILKTGYKNKKILVSGSGQVGSYAALKAVEYGGIVVGMSDVSGFLYNEEGLNVEEIIKLKIEDRKNLDSYKEYKIEATFNKNYHDFWKIKCDIALPCATQNELNEEDAQNLISNGVLLIGEGANKPTTKQAQDLFMKHKVIFCPSKASNAGGVYVSGLEIKQNRKIKQFTRKEVDELLLNSMRSIFEEVYQTSKTYNKENNLSFGANVSSFKRIANGLITKD